MASSVFDLAHQGDHPFEMRRKASFSKLSGGSVSRPMAGAYADEGQAAIAPQKSRIFNLTANYSSTDTRAIQTRIINHVEYTLARTRFNFYEEDCYRATAYSVRDRLLETFKDTSSFYFEKDTKRCYYLSLEFLMGRSMQNCLVNLDIEEPYRKALGELGYALESLYEYEHDAALGNGGLGRLAACFLDSMATCNYPCWGYGIRYTYGIFEQKIVSGRQVEHPDYWLVQDNPWEIQRQDITYAVRFGGEVKQIKGPNGTMRSKWTGGQLVQAIAYDNPIPGFDTYNCNNLRLWKAAPSREFDFTSFNAGRYIDAIAERQNAECISSVLYPNDESEEGKVLRLKQQYFFCCATIQDVLRRFKKKADRDWNDLPKKIRIQLNDTHPTVAIPELMRILVDIEELDWDFAWRLTGEVFSYTNHTVLPEALEKWPADLFGKLLPRHLMIINDINLQFLTDVRSRVTGDNCDMIQKMSIYAEGWTKMLRMANLAVIGSHKVNGVAAIHSEIVKRDLFPEFVRYYEMCGQPDKFINITNGVTPRRWIHAANRPLSNLISEWLGCDDWLKDLDSLRGLQNHMEDDALIFDWQSVKLRNKKRLAKHVEHTTGIKIDPVQMLFDVQVKRMHEYKRQALNCLFMVHRYLTIKKMSAEERRRSVVPRAVMVGGKAAPGYFTAKTIIKMINNIASVVNNDPDVSEYFKVVYIPNYNVSQAMIIIPGADLNQQISTAGTEASGTSNMKFVMNGSLIIGTLDGATVEIREECGDDTVFLFGACEQEVEKIRSNARNGYYPIDLRLRSVLEWIRGGHLALGDSQAHNEFCQLIDRLQNNKEGQNGDYYLCCHDFPDYLRANEDVDRLYQDQRSWTQLAIKAASAMGKFSTDRTIQEYASLVWDLDVCERKPPVDAAEHQTGYRAMPPAAANSIQDKSSKGAAEFTSSTTASDKKITSPSATTAASSAPPTPSDNTTPNAPSPTNLSYKPFKTPMDDPAMDRTSTSRQTAECSPLSNTGVLHYIDTGRASATNLLRGNSNKSPLSAESPTASLSKPAFSESRSRSGEDSDASIRGSGSSWLGRQKDGNSGHLISSSGSIASQTTNSVAPISLAGAKNGGDK